MSCNKNSILTGVIVFTFYILFATSALGKSTFKQKYELKNDFIKAGFTIQKKVCELTDLSRIDGSNLMVLNNDEFEILFFDKTRVTAKQYLVENII